MAQADQQYSQDILEGIPLKERFHFYTDPERNSSALRRLKARDLTIEEFDEVSTYDVFAPLIDNGELNGEKASIRREDIEKFEQYLREYDKLKDTHEPGLIGPEYLEEYRSGRERVEDANIETWEDYEDLNNQLSGLSGIYDRFSRGKEGISRFYDWGMAEAFEEAYWQLRTGEILEEHSEKEIEVVENYSI